MSIGVKADIKIVCDCCGKEIYVSKDIEDIADTCLEDLTDEILPDNWNSITVNNINEDERILCDVCSKKIVQRTRNLPKAKK